MIRPVCTRRFSTKNTPEEIHDKLRMSKLESEPFVYILSSESPDKLFFKPHRVGSWLIRNSFAGELVLHITPTDTGSDIVLELIQKKFTVWFVRLWIAFAALFGLATLISCLSGYTAQYMPLLIPWVILLFFYSFYTVSCRLTARSLERQIKDILDEE